MASTITTTTNTMSLKRYAIIAAASYHKSHQENDNHNITIVKTTTKTEAVTESNTKLVTSTATTSPSLSPPLATESQSSITTAKTSLFSSFYAYGDDGDEGDDDEINDNNSSSGSSVPPAFYGGLSPFHQQNIRSGHGINGSNGASYPNAINGNVNLLLGGAMLSLVTTILCVVCYCCHRSIKKRTEAAYRQQRQWLESDPNMEIYSVEQCYETSGLFMAESNDGVPTLPTLHHEPPPSYDAVVLMQEQQLLYQQQQQQLLQQQHNPQRTSPPPGYRSTIDVSMTVATAATAAAAIPTATLYTATDATSYNNSNTDNHSNNSCDTINDSLNTVSSVRRCDFSKSITNSITTANQLFNMKRVWSAQSCCSLQRAEVESMWNAAAAAVAARATHAEHVAEQQQQQQSTTSSIMVRKTLPSTAATPSATARISTPSARAASSSSVERFGQHYLKESFYQRGCPLCGKFRYDVDDGPISISIESDLDQSMEMNGNKREVIREELQLDGGNKMSTVTKEKNKNTQEPRGTAAGHQKLIGAATESTDGDNEECSCAATASNMPIAAVAATARNYLDGTNSIEDEIDDDANIKDNNKENVECDDDDDENGNLAAYVGSGDLFECYAVSPELDEFYHAADEADKAHASLCNRTAADNNANLTLSPPSTATVVDAADDVSRDNIELVDLSTINDNGIVRLDMSKIIDNTGLPTYEAALKFDSSGYV